jgi:hypothetical protein
MSDRDLISSRVRLFTNVRRELLGLSHLPGSGKRPVPIRPHAELIMFVVLSEIRPENTRPATDELTELLASLGFDAVAQDVELELAIDRFDMWTNPRDAALYPSTCGWHDTDVESERAA